MNRFIIEDQKKALDNKSVDFPLLRKKHKALIQLLKERRDYAFGGQLDGDKAILRADIIYTQAENELDFEKIKQISEEIDYLQKQSRKIHFASDRDKDTLKWVLRHTAQNLGGKISTIMADDYSTAQQREMPDSTFFFGKHIQGTHWNNSAAITYTEARKMQKQCIAAMEEEDKKNGGHISISKERQRLSKIEFIIFEKCRPIAPVLNPYLHSVDIDKKIDDFINTDISDNKKIIEKKNNMVADCIAYFSRFLYENFSKDDILKDNEILKSFKDKWYSSYIEDINKWRQKQKKILSIIKKSLEKEYGKDILKGIVSKEIDHQIMRMSEEEGRFKNFFSQAKTIDTSLSQADSYIKEYANKDIFKDKNYSDIKDKLIYLYNRINEQMLTMDGWTNKIKEFEPMANDFYNSIKDSNFSTFADYLKSRERQKRLLQEINHGTFKAACYLDDKPLKEYIYG